MGVLRLFDFSNFRLIQVIWEIVYKNQDDQEKKSEEKGKKEGEEKEKFLYVGSIFKIKFGYFIIK